MKSFIFILVILAAVLFGTAATVTAVDPININTASKAELMQLDGIGEAYAKAIIAYREANGPFKQPGDIVNVKGIGPATYEKNKERIAVASPEAAKPASQGKTPPKP